jgi:hypothetical protein
MTGASLAWSSGSRGHVSGRLPATGDAGVVDEHVEPACLLADLFGGGLDRVVAGDIDD